MTTDYETPLCSKRAAKLLSLAPRTLDQMRWQGRGPTYRKVGRQVRYLPSDLRAFLDRDVRQPSEMAA